MIKKRRKKSESQSTRSEVHLSQMANKPFKIAEMWSRALSRMGAYLWKSIYKSTNVSFLIIIDITAMRQSTHGQTILPFSLALSLYRDAAYELKQHHLANSRLCRMDICVIRRAKNLQYRFFTFNILLSLTLYFCHLNSTHT